jgi:L-rhamnose isomerase
MLSGATYEDGVAQLKEVLEVRVRILARQTTELVCVAAIFKDKIKCITLYAPRDQLHISRQIKEKYHHICLLHNK